MEETYLALSKNHKALGWQKCRQIHFNKKHLSLHPFGASPNWSPNSTCRFCLKELLDRTCVQGCPRSWQSKIAFIIADFPASAEHKECSTMFHIKCAEINRHFNDISILWSRFLSRSRASIFLNFRFNTFNNVQYIMTLYDLP